MSDTTLNATESGMLADIRLHDIVVGVDGSDESFAALRWALNEASLTGQQVNAVFAWSHSWIWARNRKMKSSGPKSAMRSHNGFATGFPKLRRA